MTALYVRIMQTEGASTLIKSKQEFQKIVALNLLGNQNLHPARVELCLELLSLTPDELSEDQKTKVDYVKENLDAWLKVYPLKPTESLGLRIAALLPGASLGGREEIDTGNHEYNITLGAALIDRLSKEELVGVVAHEWGHKLNGDKAIGHQYEFGADATAVMLTRNPKALISGLYSQDGPVNIGEHYHAIAQHTSSDSHPSREARVANIKRVATQMGLSYED